MTAPDHKTVTNWRLIEIDYRAGTKTLRQIASEHGITHGAVNKRAKKDGWTRDLAAKIRAKADEKVSRAAVSNSVSKATKVAEQQVIEANAMMQADIILRHRSSIGEAREHMQQLLKEAAKQSGNVELLEKLAELVTADDTPSNKRYEVFMRAISLPSRAQTLDKLASALERIVRLERQAFGIDREEEKPKDPIDDMTREELEREILAIFDNAKVVNGEAVEV